MNALPREAFLGEVPGSYSRRGRIPTSVNLPSSNLLDRTNRFLPPAELDRAFGEAEVAKDEPLVAYCGGGIAATVDVFALFLTGSPNARLYDDSFPSGALTHCCRSSPVELSNNGLHAFTRAPGGRT